jgi:hypothetical protein
MIPDKPGQNPQAPPNPLQAAVDAGGGAFLQTDQMLQGIGMTADQAKQLAGALTQGGQTNPLITAAIGQEQPAINQYSQQYAQAEAGLAGLGASQTYQDTLLQQSTDLQGQQLTNQLQGNQLQSQNVAQQLGIAQGQNQLQNQLAGVQQGQLSYNLGLAQDQARSQGAISGTLNTQGYQQKQGQLQEAYDVSSAELQNQLAGQNLTFKGQQLSSANQQAQLANTAAALGISQQQLQNQLSSGLAQIGVQTGQTGEQLLSQASQAQAGEAQGMGAILSTIGAVTGGGPQMFTGTNPNLYSGGK